MIYIVVIDVWFRLSYQCVCLNLGQYQVYEVKSVDERHYIELTIIPDPAMPPECEVESYKESRELITAVMRFINELMVEHLTAIVEKSPAECYIACPGCDELHIKLESFPSTGRCFCFTKRDHCDLLLFHKVLSSKGILYIPPVTSKLSCNYRWYYPAHSRSTHTATTNT